MGIWNGAVRAGFRESTCHVGLDEGTASEELMGCVEQILCIIPVPILRWVLVGAAAASSGFFL